MLLLFLKVKNRYVTLFINYIDTLLSFLTILLFGNRLGNKAVPI